MVAVVLVCVMGGGIKKKIVFASRRRHTRCEIVTGVQTCRLVRLQDEICPADARPPVRRDGRCQWQTRFRADPVDPRAAYPPRKGDEQYLHQLRSVRAGVQHPHEIGRHTSELQSLMRISYAVFCLKQKKTTHITNT